jgi:hypothetical protein
MRRFVWTKLCCGARCAAIVVTLLGVASTAALAVGTPNQRTACTPDVFRLCGAQIPSVERIVACLKKERPHLSPACRAVFTAKRTRAAVAAPWFAAPEQQWCVFRRGALDAKQRTWLTWCGSAARRQ